jgi:hypothetical protein
MTRRWILIATCMLVIGCAGGSETGNPGLLTQIGLSVRSSEPSAVAVSNGAQSTVIDQAWVAFGQLRFLSPGQCGLLDSFPHMGPTLIAADLAAPEVRIKVPVKPGAYCGMVVPLENESQDLTGSAPGELSHHSIVVRGHRNDGVSFALMYPEQDELELQALAGTEGFDVAPDRNLFLVFDVAAWMSHVDLDSAELEDDGTIRIDATRNVRLRLSFEASIDCSLELFEDTNGSGALEAGDERIARCAAN